MHYLKIIPTAFLIVRTFFSCEKKEKTSGLVTGHLSYKGRLIEDAKKIDVDGLVQL